MWWIALACGGSPTPIVEGIHPDAGKPGDVVRVAGEHLPADARLELDGVPLEGQRVLGVAALEGRVPAGATPGPHPMELVLPDGRRLAAGTFEVQGGPRFVGTPCGGDFTSFSALATDQGRVVIDKHHRAADGGAEGRRETLRIPFEEVEAVLYEVRPLDGGGRCTAIWIALRDGRRELFDDDEHEELLGRAQEIAVALGRPLRLIGKR